MKTKGNRLGFRKQLESFCLRWIPWFITSFCNGVMLFPRFNEVEIRVNVYLDNGYKAK